MDPSFAGQIVVPTYPLIGNYGINERDFESKRVQVSGFVVREHSLRPSHSLSTMTLDDFLRSQDVPGISGVDTRAITRRLRTSGVMMGMVAVGQTPQAALTRLKDLPRYGDIDFVRQVSTDKPYQWDKPLASTSSAVDVAGIAVTWHPLDRSIRRMLYFRPQSLTTILSVASGASVSG